MDRRAPLLLLAAVAVLARLAWLGSHGWMPEEARYAEIAREMAAGGDFWVPHLSGVLYFEKPPMLAWLGAGGLSLGLPPEWTLRLIPALTSLLATAAIAALARRLWDGRTALQAALWTLTVPLPWAFAHTYSTDGPFADAITVAIALVAIETQEGRARWSRLAAAGAALAFASLVRSPLLALAIVGPISLLAAAGGGRGATLRRLLVPPIVGIALAAPWFVAVSLREPGFFDEYFVKQHFGRIGAPEDEKNLHRESIVYYLPVYLWGMGGAILAGPVAAAAAARRAMKVGIGAARERGALLVVAAPLWILVLFSLLAGKRVPYVLPAFPWLALAVAAAFADAERSLRFRRALAWAFAFPAGVILAAAAASFAVVRLEPSPVPLPIFLLVAAAVACATALPAWLLFRGRAGAASTAACLGVAAAFALGASQVSRLETVGNLTARIAGETGELRLDTFGIAPLARDIAARAAPGDVVAHLGRYRPALDFYTGQPTTLFAGPGELAFGVAAARDDPATAARFRRERDFAQALGGTGRVLALADLTDLFDELPVPDPKNPRAAPRSGDVPIYVLARVGRYGVVSNRPGSPP